MNYFQFWRQTPESGEECEFDSLESFLTSSSCIMCKASTAFLDAKLISIFSVCLKYLYTILEGFENKF